MICTDYGCFIIIVVACFSWGYYNAFNGSKFKLFILRRKRWGGSNFVPTPILIFWAPRGLHFNSSRIWANFPHCSPRKWEERDLWCFRYSVRYNGHWGARVCRVGSSYIHSRYGCRHPGVFYVSYDNYCCSYWD